MGARLEGRPARGPGPRRELPAACALGDGPAAPADPLRRRRNGRVSADDGSCWYFAYGSNMARGTFIERRGMQPLGVRRAYLDDHRLCFDLPIGPGGARCREPRRRARRADPGASPIVSRRRRARSSTGPRASIAASIAGSRSRWWPTPRAGRGRSASWRSRIEASAVIRAGSRRRAISACSSPAPASSRCPRSTSPGSDPFPLAIDEREALDDRQRASINEPGA